MFREGKLCLRDTALIEDSIRIEEEINAHREEKIKLLERIRGQEEDLQIASENKRKLNEKIEELQKECTELRAPVVVYETQAMRLTEEELQKKRTDETRYYTELINKSDRQKQQMEKDIEDHKRENVKLLDRIRAKEEEIQKAREEEGNLKKRIEELEKECDDLKLEENVNKLEGDKKKLAENAVKLDDDKKK
ncbi:moesin/ezrin/radixin homolog 1-like [Mya arenaria]|uniref:moesin/ezrin/radixin homolog 1-like n=1 Tax=Mya arenaria TaxID=6604 RepID=UPI0022DEDFC0|nr:moesin/ezrin/radixin homolog 1-like [Mya arenaria]